NLDGTRALTLSGTTSIKREDYVYDALARTIEVKSGTSASVAGVKRGAFTYDALGRLTLQNDYDTNGTTVLFSRSVTYNDKSQVTFDSTSVKRGSTIYKADNTYDYGTGSSYALGAALSITTVNYENNVQKKTNL